MNDSSDTSNPFKIVTIILIGIVIIQFVVIALLASSKPANLSIPQNIDGVQSDGITLEVPENTFKSAPTVSPVSDKYDLGKSYSITIEEKGNSLGEVEYLVSEYEFTNQVVVNGIYNALLKEDRELLVLHVEITNNTKRPMEIISSDSVRIRRGEEEKLLAPNISDDPVKVRPKSTVETTVGFTLNKDDEEIVLLLGDLDGEQEEINLVR